MSGAAAQSRGGGLPRYDHYWHVARGMGDEAARRRMREIRDSVSGTWGSGDDPLGAHTPAAQNSMLGQLARRAAGRIDDWESLVDPTVSYGENVAILERHGAEELDSEIEEDRKQWIEDNPDRQRRRARDAIRDNLEEIEAGGADQLLADVREEYGSAFVDDAIERAKALEPATGGAPEPSPQESDYPEPEPAEEPTADPEPEPEPDPEPVEAPTAAATPEPAAEPEPSPILKWIADLPGAIRSLATAAYVLLRWDPPQTITPPTATDGGEPSQKTIGDYQ